MELFISDSILTKLDDMGISMKRNQDITIKYLMTHRKKIIEVAYIDEEDNGDVDRKRHELLQRDSVSFLIYYLKIPTNLLLE